MIPQSTQFDGVTYKSESSQPLPRGVKRNYKQLSEAISLQIKQEKLRRLQHFPWEMQPQSKA